MKYRRSAYLRRLHAPVGLDIGAETAEEIALSIVCEIKTVLSQRTGAPLRERDGSIHSRSTATISHKEAQSISYHFVPSVLFCGY